MIKVLDETMVYRAVFEVDKMTEKELDLKSDLIDCVPFGIKMTLQQLDQLEKIDQKYEALLRSGKPCPNKSYIIYFAVRNLTILGMFLHMYAPKQLTLGTAYMNEAFRKMGYGTIIYNKVKQDLFENIKVDSIYATVVSESGKNLLKKMEFLVESYSVKHKTINVVLPKESEKNNSKYKSCIPLSEFVCNDILALDDNYEY